MAYIHNSRIVTVRGILRRYELGGISGSTSGEECPLRTAAAAPSQVGRLALMRGARAGQRAGLPFVCGTSWSDCAGTALPAGIGFAWRCNRSQSHLTRNDGKHHRPGLPKGYSVRSGPFARHTRNRSTAADSGTQCLLPQNQSRVLSITCHIRRCSSRDNRSIPVRRYPLR